MAMVYQGAGRHVQAGITLIELLVVVAIVAILASVAYPSYQVHIARAARAQAESILLENAQIIERTYTVANRYDQDTAGNAPVIFTTSPKADEGPVKYNIAVAYGDIETDDGKKVHGQTFTLTATPAGSMVGDACGNLTLDQAGKKGASGGTVADCWRQ